MHATSRSGWTLPSLALGLVTAAAPAAASGAPGSLDTSFGFGGRVTVPFNLGGDLRDEARDMVIQPDRMTVVAGYAAYGPTDDDFAIVRLDETGALDPAFGNNGKITVAFDLDDAKRDRAQAVALQPDGKIVVAGRVSNGAKGTDFGVARLLPNGLPDGLFGVNGKVTIGFDFPGSNFEDVPYDVALQPDGKIVVVGYAAVGAANTDVAAVRLLPNGALDSSFLTDGRVLIAFDYGGPGVDVGEAVAIQPDGKLVIVGWTEYLGTTVMGVIRTLPNGVLDFVFNGGGKTIFPVGTGGIAFAEAVALESDGRIVVAGFGKAPTQDFAILRLTPSGYLDPTFGNGGPVLVDVNGGDDDGVDLLIQPGGLIVVAGIAERAPGDLDFAALRLRPDGSLDSSFGDGGKAMVPMNGEGQTDWAWAVALRPDARLQVAGGAVVGTSLDFAVAQLFAEAPLFTDGFESGDVSAWSAP